MTEPDRAPILYAVDGGVARIELNRPEAFNALDVAVARALTRAAEEAQADDRVKAVLLTGRGRAFCAGGDVRMMAEAEDVGTAVHELATAAHEGILALDRLGKPVVAAVHGSVAGAGLGLACAADLVLAGESTRFVAAYAGIAVTPDCGVTWALPRLVGQRRALQLTLLNRPLSATEAEQWGLVTEVHPDGDVLAAGLALAQRLASAPAATALGATRRLVRDSAERGLADQLDAEAASISALVTTAEARSLVQAFVSRSSS